MWQELISCPSVWTIEVWSSKEIKGTKNMKNRERNEYKKWGICYLVKNQMRSVYAGNTKSA